MWWHNNIWQSSLITGHCHYLFLLGFLVLFCKILWKSHLFCDVSFDFALWQKGTIPTKSFYLHRHLFSLGCHVFLSWRLQWIIAPPSLVWWWGCFHGQVQIHLCHVLVSTLAVMHVHFFLDLYSSACMQYCVKTTPMTCSTTSSSSWCNFPVVVVVCGKMLEFIITSQMDTMSFYCIIWPVKQLLIVGLVTFPQVWCLCQLAFGSSTWWVDLLSPHC